MNLTQSRNSNLFSSWRSLLIFLLYINTSSAQFTLVGENKPASDRGFHHIHSLSSAFGKVYMGYGGWNDHPGPVILTSYDPVTGITTAEHSLNTDSVGPMRLINGKLYIPSIDPIHYQYFEDYTIVHQDGHIERRTPNGFLHLFDIFERENGELWMMGSQLPNETPVTGGAIFQSVDAGRTWLNKTPGYDPEMPSFPIPDFLVLPSRYYWGFENGGSLHFERKTYTDSWSLNGAYSMSTAGKFERTTGENGVVDCYIANITPGSDSIRTGSIQRVPGGAFASGIDYALNDGVAYVLSQDQKTISVSTDLSKDEVTLKNFTVFESPSLFDALTSIHVHEGILYGGSRNGNLYAINLDGSSVAERDVIFESKLPERAGEQIIVDGNQMAISVPRSMRKEGHIRNAYLEAGKVIIYERESQHAPWLQKRVIEIWTENLHREGTWFGSHIDLNDDQLVIVEGGSMSGGDRGRGAEIWRLVKNDGAWNWGTRNRVEFAHGVAVVNGHIYGSVVYEIVIHDYVNDVFHGLLTAEDFYHPYVTFAYDRDDQDILVCGQTSDLSRGGGKGRVTIFDGTKSVPTILQTIDHSYGTSRFGYSLDVRNGLLAVGAPMGGHAQAGYVSLYRKNLNGRFVLEDVLFTSGLNAEANFGHSVAITDGGVVYVSAPGAEGPLGRRGKVFAFHKSNEDWSMLSEFSPKAEDSLTWEYGMRLEPDGHQVMVASAQVDESLPYLDRIDYLPRTPENFSLWANFQGYNEPQNIPSYRPNGKNYTLLEAFALRSDEGNGLQVVLVDGTPYCKFMRRKNYEDYDLEYLLEFSSDLESWQIIDQGNAVLETDDWVSILTQLPTQKGYVRVSVSIGEE